MEVKKSIQWSIIISILMLATPSLAAEAPKVDTCDTAWFSGVQHS
ncbi:Uncharacterised protein [uncultured archaeon]|nr:Uncharacterised protein [uncultured archaeon]